MLLPHDRTTADAFRPRSPGLTRLLVLVLVWVGWLVAPAAIDAAAPEAASHQLTAVSGLPTNAACTRWSACREFAEDDRQHQNGRGEATAEDELDQKFAAPELAETGEDWATAAALPAPLGFDASVVRPPRAHDRCAEAVCVHRSAARAPPTPA